MSISRSTYAYHRRTRGCLTPAHPVQNKYKYRTWGNVKSERNNRASDGGANAQSALSSYNNPSANGTHFLIDKDGTIYQTASVFQQTWHVGKLRSRCRSEEH